MKSSILTADSVRNRRYSGYDVSEHQACTMYLYSPNFGMNIVSM